MNRHPLFFPVSRKAFQIKYFLTISILLFSLGSQAQTKIDVTGVVQDTDGVTLPGVSILIMDKADGTITDIDGRFTLRQVEANARLKFSMIGSKSEVVSVNGRNRIDVTLEPDVVGLDEVVVVGYGVQKKKEVTGAVVRVKTDVLEQSTSTDIGTMLQGHIAGVNVQASSGQPGSTSNIQIRGLSSVTGRNAPLFVVDGIPYATDPQLSTAEIESIDVLKDAASASIYGTRGAGGVILITTKQGTIGKTKINVESNYGVQKITSGIPLMDFEETVYSVFLDRLNNNNTPLGTSWTPLETDRYGFLNNSNMSEKIQNDYAPVQEHNLSLTKGNKNNLFSVILNYADQDGLLINSAYRRFNGRINSTVTADKLTVKTGAGIVLDEQENEPWQFLLQTYRYQPYRREVDPDMETIQNAGLPGTQANDINTMAAMVKQSDVRKGYSANGFVQLEYAILPDLKLTTRAGGNFQMNNRSRINPLFRTYDDRGDLVPMVQRSGVFNSNDQSTGVTLENSLSYHKSFYKHNVSLLLLQSVERYTFNYFYAQRFDLVSNSVGVLNGATSDPDAGSGTDWNQNRTNSLIGMLGRIQYNYGGKYLLSLSARRDGSSRFSKKYRWGVFPSISAGWNIAEESFWAVSPKFISDFKLRASYGTTGNQNFQDYSNASTVALLHDYVFGPEEDNILALGATQTQYANANVKWETTVQANLGVDISLLDNQLTVSADVYDTDKNDMLFPVVLPPSVGAGSDGTVILNVGNMNNRGFELAANFRQAGTFSWSIGGTISRNKNTITKMTGTNKIVYMAGGTAVDGIANPDRLTVIAEGYQAGAFFLMKTDGVIKSNEELAAYKELDPTARLGDLRYVDSDENGLITDEDRVYMGSGTPDIIAGLNLTCDYKNFDFSMQWYGAHGNKIINSSKIYAYIYGTHKDLVYQWSPHNPDSDIPAFRGVSHANYRGYTDQWLEDGSYIRLRNITLGYNVPIKNSSISKLRFYVTGQNLLTLTRYTGFDPEVGNDGLQSRGIDKGNYPIGIQGRLGVSINF